MMNICRGTKMRRKEKAYPNDQDDGDLGTAFVYFQLTETDDGSIADRTNQKNFQDRTPWCARISLDGVSLVITNSGDVASDLVIIDYRVVFCTLETHGPADGFTADHTQEARSDSLTRFENVTYVPPRGISAPINIPFPPFPAPKWLKNVYFQARVSTLWTETIPMDEWEFATDRCVTEIHLRI